MLIGSMGTGSGGMSASATPPWPPLAKPKRKREEANATGDAALATASLASVAELKSEVYNLEKMGWTEGTIAKPKSECTTERAEEHLHYKV